MRLPGYTWILGSVGLGIQPRYCEKTGRSLLQAVHGATVSQDQVDAEYRECHNLLEEASRAYKSGEKLLAQRLSKRGQQHNQRAKALAHKQMRQVFWANNQGRDLCYEVDLHGLRAFEALSALAAIIPYAKSPYHVITGVGKGSQKGSVLNKAVVAFCRSRGHKFEYARWNHGMLVLCNLK